MENTSHSEPSDELPPDDVPRDQAQGSETETTPLSSDDSKDENDATLIPVTESKSHRARVWESLAVLLAFTGFLVTVAAMIFLPLAIWSGYGDSGMFPESRTDSTPIKPKTAVAYNLDFPLLYPDIASKPGSECRKAWDALTHIPCHDKLFNRASDNSTWRTLEWDPMYFLPRICENRCRAALDKAYGQLSAKCSSADTFVLQGYHGMFSPAWLESGPAAAVEVLVRRTEHLCRSSPVDDSDYEYCHIDMLERFGVMDGVNPNLWAINTFMRDTDKNGFERGGRKRGSRETGTYRYRYNYKVRDQKLGPGAGETSCSWCTFDFFNRTLNSWTQGAHLSPESNQPVSLPEFLRRVRRAGRRCAPTAKWDEMYNAAVARYISTGVLPADWEVTLPSGDLHYLIHNGPSLGDSPILEIRAERARLSSPQFRQSWNGTRLELSHSTSCLVTLERNYLSTNSYINLPKDMLSKMMGEERESTALREAYCSQSTSKALEALSDTACLPSLTTSKVLELAKEYRASRRTREVYCDLFGQRSYQWNCAQSLGSMNKTSWAFTGRPKTTVFLAELDTALEELKKKLSLEEVAPSLNNNNNQKQLSSSKSRAKAAADRSKEKILGNTVCAGCIWKWLTGTSMDEIMENMRGASSVSEYVNFVKKYHTTCTSLGATWLGGVPYGDDPIVWRVKNEDGKVLRYIKGPKVVWYGDAVHAVDEATGEVTIYQRHRGNRPGLDVGSLWHVLQAQRGLDAKAQGRFEEWKAEEEEHRKEADKAVWTVDERSGDLEYIRPKNGLQGEKKEQE
ncbi:hypothetical protein B0T10DRAFT_498861 [Thelonectria olida]|uniref:Uncharacterized protein n=1 Tax=Thelonectria olida TaxID=1576542 RepID=A0A9P8VUK0_9HYPO|nr:hypothetical protein B0T10DRAFT_498861 [Thelonectria olida]